MFTVEVLKAHFHLDSAEAKEGLLDWLRNQFSDKRRQHEGARLPGELGKQVLGADGLSD